jgi:rubredoxin
MESPRRVIVSRHAAAIAFIRNRAPEFADAEVIASAAPIDVMGAIVAGNIPLHLAALAEEVIAVEFDGPPPRGAEYGLPEMEAAGARLARYRVESLDEDPNCPSCQGEGYIVDYENGDHLCGICGGTGRTEAAKS